MAINFGNTAWTAGKLLTGNSATVTLRRRGYADAVISATKTKVDVVEEFGDGSSIRHEGFDFLIATDDYRFGGALSEPQNGDLIIETVGSVERQYELRPFAGEACARPMDQSRAMWRCHTKLVTRTARLLTENQLRAIVGLQPVIGDEWNENELRHAAGIASLAA